MNSCKKEKGIWLISYEILSYKESEEKSLVTVVLGT